MLIAAGWAVRIELEDGPTLVGAAGAALLHDPSGRHWGSCSALVHTIHKLGAPCDDAYATKYLGTPKQGEVSLPPRALSGWKFEGRAEAILYTRRGKHAGHYAHPFGETSFAGFQVGQDATLFPRVYSWRGAYRIELGPQCVWNEKGIVYP